MPRAKAALLRPNTFPDLGGLLRRDLSEPRQHIKHVRPLS